MSSHSRWSDEEKRILVENYGQAPKDKLKKLLLNRSWSAIQSYARRLKISKPSKPWTEEENKIVKENYSTMPRDVLEKLLPNRTWEQIRRRARHFRVHRKLAYWVRSNKELNITGFELGYLTAIIDGEGCITLSSSYKRKGETCYRPLISISNTNIHIINYVKRILEPFGWIRLSPRKHGWKKVYVITITRLQDVLSVIRRVLPFLRGKRRQAELVLEFINLRREWRPEIIHDQKGRMAGTRKYKRTEREKEIYKEIHALNS